MCRDKVVDVKVVVLDLTNDGATVHYASGAKSFGNFKTKIAARFSRDVLTGTFPNGADLVLGMRPDGHMNVKYDTDRWCTGIMQRTKSLPTS